MTVPARGEPTGPDGTGRTAPDQAERKARASQSFWTMVVGVPAIFSVLRLGVEAGGELQTTLLLVANVGPVNLVAGLFTTAARLVSTGLVAIFAIGGVLSASADQAASDRAVSDRIGPDGAGSDQVASDWVASDRGAARRPLFARWTEMTPAWFIVATFAVAFTTWQILYLPLLLPALAAAFQVTPARLHELLVPRVALILAALGAYGWLVLPTLLDAARQRVLVPLLLLSVPPLLALTVAGPVPAFFIRPLAAVAQVAVLAMLFWAAVPVITAPVLPLTVTTVDDGNGGTEDVRGHVVTVDDVNTVILQERGGVRYVPVERVRSQVLCPTERELPRHRLRIRDFHVEDSLLEALGRRVRPVTRVDAACRIVPNP